MSKKLDGLKLALCQMRVAPGCPDLNAQYMIGEIEAARVRGADIVVFPEMAETGYLVGDIFEDVYFMQDVQRQVAEIVKASRGITVMFGAPVIDEMKKGEDGRRKKYNAAIVAGDGKVLRMIMAVGGTIKSLQPNYRFFNDDKHFFSMRKVAEARGGQLNDFLSPLDIPTGIGSIKVGVILCEDMWHEDYIHNPTRALVDHGAEIVLNLSSSPWGWQKNRKRHQVVRDLVAECKVPFVYVNNTGVQSIGKNIVIFDGSSAVYNKNGEIVFEIPPYVNGTHDLVFSESLKRFPPRPQNDAKELYDAMVEGVKFTTPRGNKKVVVGLSGGIDSAVVAALMTDIFGSERVLGVNMPFRDYNSQESQAMAEQIAENLGIEYLVKPIDRIVAAIAEDDIRPGEFEYENIQAIARMTVLSKLAKKYGGVFTCNSNKVELAFGYSTLYGDLAGFYAPLGDIVKREVRQIADYQNLERFKREVIPQECIDAIPTAGLRPNQKDPFDYGDLTRRGYHDEMVRAFIEFRKNPEWFLELYIGGQLERELMLTPGTLARLFPTDKDFVVDLRRCWGLFHNSWFKRNQGPFIPVYSRRAFGRDYEESLLRPHFTSGYLDLEETSI